MDNLVQHLRILTGMYGSVCPLIFLARVFDVTREPCASSYLARTTQPGSLLGFIETFVWIIAVSSLVKHAENFAAFFGYAGGFAAGTLVGMLIENKLAVGTLTIRAILRRDPKELITPGRGRFRGDPCGCARRDRRREAGVRGCQTLRPAGRDRFFHRTVPGAFLRSRKSVLPNRVCSPTRRTSLRAAWA